MHAEGIRLIKETDATPKTITALIRFAGLVNPLARMNRKWPTTVGWGRGGWVVGGAYPCADDLIRAAGLPRHRKSGRKRLPSYRPTVEIRAICLAKRIWGKQFPPRGVSQFPKIQNRAAGSAVGCGEGISRRILDAESAFSSKESARAVFDNPCENVRNPLSGLAPGCLGRYFHDNFEFKRRGSVIRLALQNRSDIPGNVAKTRIMDLRKFSPRASIMGFIPREYRPILGTRKIAIARGRHVVGPDSEKFRKSVALRTENPDQGRKNWRKRPPDLSCLKNLLSNSRR